MKHYNIFAAVACLFAGLVLGSCSEDEVPTFGGVYGIVSDAETGDALRNAQVILSPGNLSTVTGVDGHYEFKDLDAGQAKIQVSANGYVTDSRQVTIVPGMTSQCDVSLKREVLAAKLELSSTSLDFGSEQSSLSFSIHNAGNAGSVKWQIMDVPEWVTVSPSKGETAVGKSSAVVVSLNRNLVKKDETATMRVVTDGESFPVDIIAKASTNFTFSVTPDNLSFGTEETIRMMTLRNENYNGTLQWSIQDYSSIRWIRSVHPSSGSLGKGASAEVTVTIDRSAITQKTSATIYIQAESKVIPVIVTCDYSEKPKAYVEMSPTGQIDFGKDKNSATVTLKAHYGSFDFNAELEGNPAWVSLDKKSGTLEEYETAGKSCTLTLTVDRTKMTADDMESTLKVRAGDSVQTLALKVSREPVEDYSSATIESGHNKIVAEIISCKWSGSSVVLEYTLTNVGLEENARLSMFSSTSGNYVSNVYDNNGNEYSPIIMTFRDANNYYSDYLSSTFPQGPKCKASITVKNVKSDAKTMSYSIDVGLTWPASYTMHHKMYFKNVPIYK